MPVPPQSVVVEVRGLRVRARIGVSEEELESERELLIDIEAVREDAGAVRSDRIEETLDYAAAATLAQQLACSEPHRTLERLAARVAEAVLAMEGCRRASVRVAKPRPPMEQEVDHVAVTVGVEAPR